MYSLASEAESVATHFIYTSCVSCTMIVYNYSRATILGAPSKKTMIGLDKGKA